MLLPQHVLLCIGTRERAPTRYIDGNLTGDDCRQGLIL